MKDGGKDVQTIVVEIDDVRHMLIAPTRDVFSTRPYVYMGQSVVERLLDYFEHQKGLGKKEHRLVLSMPRDKITPGLAKEIESTLDRFTATQIKDNQYKLSSLRRRGLLQIPYSLIFLGASVSLGILFGSEVIIGLSSYMSTVLSEGMFIVGWVAMWGPIDTLLFGRFPIIAHNRALRALERMKIEIRPREGT